MNGAWLTGGVSVGVPVGGGVSVGVGVGESVEGVSVTVDVGLGV